MDLPIFTNPTTNKPWLNIYANSVTANTLSGTDLKTDYISTKAFNCGTVLLATATQAIVAPVGANGAVFAFNPALNKLTISGVAGVNACFDTTDGGATLTTLVTPAPNFSIQYAPELNLYTAIDGAGTAVYTSPDATVGSFVLQAPSTGTFDTNQLRWIPYFMKFYTGCSDPGTKVISSTDGITWVPQVSLRGIYDLAFSPLLNRLVAVGNEGPQYSDDGKTWTPSATTRKMSSVCWSDFWKCWVASPRQAPRDEVYRSVDGINWTVHVFYPGYGGDLRSIIWIQDLMVFVMSGDNDTLLVSQDGLTFRPVQLVVSGLSSYGSTYVNKWGSYISSGIGGFIRVGPKLFV